MYSDLRSAYRGLLSTPWVAGVCVVILALSLASNATALVFLQGAVFAPFDFPEPERVIEIQRGARLRFGGAFSAQDLDVLRQHASVIGEVAGYRQRPATVGDDYDSATPAIVAEVTPNLFGVLRAAAKIGRTISPTANGEDAGAVAVIGANLWETSFGHANAVLGRTLYVDGRPFTIIGVMPRGFSFYQGASAWIPWLPDEAAAGEPAHFAVIARLPDGGTIWQAAGLLTSLSPSLSQVEQGQPDSGATQPLTVSRIADGWNPFGAGILGALWQMAALLLLLVALANIGCVLIVRGVHRQRELAIRSALGATRARLVRLVVAESMILAAIGSALGVALTAWTFNLAVRSLPRSPLFEGLAFRLNYSTFLALLLLQALIVVGLALVPARELLRFDLIQSLRAWGLGAGTPHHARSWQVGLVVVQAGTSMVLLVGLVLATQSARTVSTLDPGFDADAVLEVWVTPGDQVEEAERRRRVAEALAALRDTPGIAAVAWTSVLAPDEIFGERRGRFELTTGLADLNAYNLGTVVSADYFDVLGLRTLAGHTFEHDGTEGRVTAVVSRSLAQRLWSAGDVLGQTFRFPGARTWLTVIGVVSDVNKVGARRPGVRDGWAMGVDPWPDVYLAADSGDFAASSRLLVRPREGHVAVAREIRSVLRHAVPGMVVEIRTVREGEYHPHEVMYETVAGALQALAIAAALLTALGAYATFAYRWATRRKEVGLRIALGARRIDVWRLVLWDVWRLAWRGLLLGTLGSGLVRQLVRPLLVGADYHAAVTLVFVGMTLLLTISLAGVVPAIRASVVDPVEVLQEP